MTGFAAGDPAGVAATWIAAIVTLTVWSYFLGARRIFRLAQYLLAGLATGYLVVLAVREVLIPDLLAPLADDPLQPLLWVALLLVAVVVAMRWLPAPVVAVPVAFLVAGTAAFALAGSLVGTLLPQLGAGMMRPAGTPVGWLNALVSMVITVLVLVAFVHGTRLGRPASAAATSGRWLLLAGLGGWLGFLVVSRLALLVDRLQFLLGDWLGLLR
jgi:hypothetical protein